MGIHYHAEVLQQILQEPFYGAPGIDLHQTINHFKAMKEARLRIVLLKDSNKKKYEEIDEWSHESFSEGRSIMMKVFKNIIAYAKVSPSYEAYQALKL